MSDTAEFYVTMAEMERRLADAVANKATDPETYQAVSTEFAEWRRDVKILSGRKGSEFALAVKEGREDDLIAEGRSALSVALDAVVVTEEG